MVSLIEGILKDRMVLSNSRTSRYDGGFTDMTIRITGMRRRSLAWKPHTPTSQGCSETNEGKSRRRLTSHSS